MTKSLWLSGFLVALVGMNVYVFFFSHKTAPREVLNLQSTTKTLETTRHEVLAADAKAAREALAEPPAPKGMVKAAAAPEAARGHAAEPAPESPADPLPPAPAADEPPPALPKPIAPRAERPDLRART
ncbi:MAG TPA: hypothetical protein VHO06_24305, partial [Polyangia bacterium]|nr:hypothetical protein [Polyangia bacterium]